ncbi:MAG: sigma-70 family RNA polymerase sigma factor [Acidobacteriia bacterium]|nr:sigma-70 family RNA polymerase sigma factor [Terriglobia bacterium]
MGAEAEHADDPTRPHEESALVARLRAGDDRAYEELVRSHGAMMLAVARRILRSEEDARDAVQEGFLAAFRALGTFEEESKLGTWLHRIVVNCALMKLRSRQRRPEEPIEDLLPKYLEDGHQADPAVAWKASAEELLGRQESRDLVRASIARLPEPYRNVLLLRDIEELDTEETARLLGVTENAVKIRLHRARQALRTLLDPHLREGGPR